MKNRLLENSFVRRVFVLIGGTAIGQLIAICSLPILTRLYTPEDFSVLAVYVSLLSMITAVSGLCLEYAIPLPKSNRVAASLCILSISNVFIFVFFISLLILISPNFIHDLLDKKVYQFIWLIPLGVLCVGIYTALQYWSIRNKKFGLISKTKITQSLGGTGVKLWAGYFLSGSAFGLVFGQLIAQSAGFISFASSLRKNDWNIFRSVRLKHLKFALRRYKKFPKYSTVEVFANTGSIQIPVILIASYALGAEAGYLMLAMQLLSTPMGMISGAVSQVYLSEGSNRFHQGELKIFTEKTIYGLAKIAFIPSIAIAILAPSLISYFLGESWRRTGELISWMVPWFFMQFITSPVSTSLYITDNHKIAFYLQIFGIFLRAGGVYFFAFFEYMYIVEYYALSGLLFYTIYLAVVLVVLNKTVNNSN